MKKKDKTPFLLKFMVRFFPVVEKFFPAIAKGLFVEIFFTPARYKYPEKELVFIRTAEKRNINFKGRKVAVYKWGKGKPVLMVHGWMGRSTQFRKFIKIFNDAGYAVVGFDAPAHGKSEGFKSHLMYFVQVIEILIGDYSFEGIIGHSLGGVAGLHVVHRGVKIPKLIMIGSPAIADDIIQAFLQRLNATWSTGNYFKEYIQKKYNHPFEHFSASYVIRQINNQPLLLIYDEDDVEVRIKQGNHLKDLYPSALLIKTKGLGHTRILKDSGVINRCLDFIKN